MELDLSAEIALGIGDNVRDIKKNTGPRRFLYRTLSTVQTPPTGITAYSLGRPTAGRLWTITAVAVAGVPGSSFALTGDNIVAVCVGNPAAPSVSDIRVVLDGSGTPSDMGDLSDQFGIDAIWCQDSESLYVQHETATGGVAVVYNAMVREYSYDDVFSHNVV